MKALVLESPNNLVLKNIPDPIIGDYDVLCKTLASSICSGTDKHIIENKPYFKVKFPAVLGHEGIGQVTECGSKVKNFQKGELVSRVINKLPANSGYSLMWGALAEKSIATDWLAMKNDGFQEQVWKKFTINRSLPKNYDPVESTMIITWRETLAFLKNINPAKNAKILIIGSGANALSFSNHLVNDELYPYVIGNPTRKKYFSSIGIDNYISYRDNSSLSSFINSNKRNINIIIDSIGNSIATNKFLTCLSEDGKLGIYGLDDIIHYQIDKSLLPEKYSQFNAEDYDEGSTHDEIISLINNKKLNAWNYLSKNHIYSINNFKKAFQENANKNCLKCVFKF